MMQPCLFCPEWAQWRILFPEKDKPIQQWKSQLVCGVHKLAAEDTPAQQERKFSFVGAVPLGLKRS